MQIVNLHNQHTGLNKGAEYLDKDTGHQVKAIRMDGQFMVRQAGARVCDDGWLVADAKGGLAYPVDRKKFTAKFVSKEKIVTGKQASYPDVKDEKKQMFRNP